MNDAIRATNLSAGLYFVSFVTIGVYCLLNMFLAIVLENFERDQQRMLEEKLIKERLQQTVQSFKSPKSKALHSVKTNQTLPKNKTTTTLLFCWFNFYLKRYVI